MPQCRLRIRIDVHTELFTVTLSADQFDLNGQHLHNQRLRELIEGKDTLRELHDVFWTSRDTPIGRIGALLSELPNNVQVVDFRGVIIPPRLPDTPAEQTTLVPSPAKPQLSAAIDTFFQTRKALLETYLTKDATPPNATEPVSDGVICSMLGGRMLYAAPLTQWAGAPRPVRYLLVTDNVEPDQLGRFVRRLHVLGELRHVALLDFDLGPGQDDLKSASRELRRLSWKLDTLVRENENEMPTVANLAGISKKLTDIHRYADGGLPYRVSQSQYYAQAFKDRLPDLRVGRIEGYQPYDAFARRFVYQVFARIEQVGQLYRTVVHETNRWTFLSEANSSSEFHEGISEATDQIKIVAKHLVRLQRHARDLLLNAEKFAAIFLVYYVGSIFVKFLHAAPFDIHISESDFNTFWGVIVIIVILDLVRSKRRRERADRELRQREEDALQEKEAAEERGIVWAAFKVVQFVADVVFFVIELPIKGAVWLSQNVKLPFRMPKIDWNPPAKAPPPPPTPTPSED